MIKMLYEPFQKWSEKGSVYIISDPHFGDKDCVLMDSNWPAPEEYINQINSKVFRNDTLICLGDCGNPAWFDRIKAKYKVLIMGNHDTGRSKYEEYFDEIYEGPLMIAPKIMLSHERIISEYWMNIHGHEHNGPEDGLYHINLAANVVNYQVFNLGAAIKEGLVSKIDTIHRDTINNATARKFERENFDFLYKL